MFLLVVANKGNVFFLQLRPGLHAKPFKIIKFKTMRDAFDAKGNALHDDIRLTKIGKWVRSASLDELLQLINVVKGDMSLVGPRPALFNQDDLRDLRTQYNIHIIPPGVTGWAQINGRDELSIPEKVKYDKEYLDRRSLWFDLKILFLTAYKVILRADISH
jgi:O-antigen biosynthesis protein WbqP